MIGNVQLHLSRLVKYLRVLTLAEAKRLLLELTHLAPAIFVNQLLEAFEPLVLDSELVLTADIAAVLPHIMAGVTRLQQVHSNLLHHTPAGGSIAVKVLPVPTGVQFSVMNTGSQLSTAELERVFQPFWRAETAPERDSGGSGLGLAISREIIALHGGTMEVESESHSVQFSFTLPASH